MALSDVIRNGMALADTLTSGQGLQETVTLYRWRAQTTTGAPVYATALTLSAIVNHSARRIMTTTGDETVTSASVAFLKPWDGLTATGREEPIDSRDKIVLANGRTGPIVRKDGGLRDPLTGKPYVVTVHLG